MNSMTSYVSNILTASSRQFNDFDNSIALAGFWPLRYGPRELHLGLGTREDETISIDRLAGGE
jgi:hypothetical protein